MLVGIEGIIFATIIWNKEALWLKTRHGSKRFAVSFELSLCYIRRNNCLDLFLLYLCKIWPHVGVCMGNLFVYLAAAFLCPG